MLDDSKKIDPIVREGILNCVVFGLECCTMCHGVRLALLIQQTVFVFNF